MDVAVFGLGYVGTVSAACLSAKNHVVNGVDLDPRKVEAINAGCSPVIEPGLDSFVSEAVRSKCLTATSDSLHAVLASQICLVCVGTPGHNNNGALNLEHIYRVTWEIGQALRQVQRYYVVVFRSTMLPGTVERHLIPRLAEASGRKPGADFGVVMNPECLREGSAIWDFNHAPRIVIGELDARSGKTLLPLYADLEAPVVRASIRTAEMIKYADNAFHALKVSFANEIGNICKQEGIDGRELMDMFCVDRQLNLSPAYLKPGFAFGGSCLPKDLRALVHYAHKQDLRVPVLESILVSNNSQLRRSFEMIKQTEKRKVGILGLSFKPGTDDLRESPAVELTETLIGKGFDVAIYDKNVSLARLLGANRAYIEREIPHIASLMRDSLYEVQAFAEVLVVTTPDPAFNAILANLASDQVLIDLVGLASTKKSAGQYQGSCW